MRTSCLITAVLVAAALAAGLGAQQPHPAPTPPASLESALTSYAAAWGEAGAAGRRQLLQRVWADKGTYTDPTVQLQGRDALVAHIGAFQEKLPGARIQITTRIDAHHNAFRFGWRIVSASGTALSEGMDYGEVDAAGRITRIVGFFGAWP